MGITCSNSDTKRRPKPEPESIEKKLKNYFLHNIKNDYSLKLNILLIGEKGVGKTTLIKSILNEKDENIKKKIINNLIFYENDIIFNLKFIEYDIVDIFGNDKLEPIIDNIKQLIEINMDNNTIFCIWYCIEEKGRIYPNVRKVLNDLLLLYNNILPIITIITRSIDESFSNEIIRYLRDFGVETPFVKVISKGIPFLHNKELKSFGKKELIITTFNKIKEKREDKFIFLENQYILEKIEKKLLKINE